MTETDLSQLANPYDFANPVSDPELFVGRRAEMDEISYYLDNSRKAARPINLAILGDRASGKTSFLNIIEVEATRKGFCVARVDLDESDSETQLGFFSKLFDSIVTAACKAGAYGGLTGLTYERYRECVDAYRVPEDTLFSPFIFPVQFSRAMAAGNNQVALSDAAFKEDMATLRGELKKPVAILIDEANVLARSRVHLEKLRNIFMNNPGFMIVISGTPKLFPVMDEVFSPIVRQFKKIIVQPFSKVEDTKACIHQPLRGLGLNPTRFISDEICGEIHEISGGRPYDIQLVCHLLFRRVQDKRAARMEVTIDVLEDVRRELESSQDISARPILAAVGRFNRHELDALAFLTTCNGRATLEQLWFAEYVFLANGRWPSKKALKIHLDAFIEDEVLTLEEGVISFRGDDFDRVYCRYLARQKNVPLDIKEVPFRYWLFGAVNSFVDDHPEGAHLLPAAGIFPSGSPEMPDIEEVHRQLLQQDEGDPFKSRVEIADALYWCNVSSRNEPSICIGSLTVTTPWAAVRHWCSLRDDAHSHSVDEFRNEVNDVASRAKELGGDVQLTTRTLETIPVDILASKVKQSANASYRSRLAGRHNDRMVKAYLNQEDTAGILFEARLMVEYERSPQNLNNLAYVLLAAEQLQEARDLLEECLTLPSEDAFTHSLANYNLAVVEAKEERLPEAVSRLRESVRSSESLTPDQRTMACLIVPFAEEGSLEFREEKEPDLHETGKGAMGVLSSLI